MCIRDSNFSGNIGSSNLFINQFVETGTLSFLHGQVDTGLSWGVQTEDFDNDGDLEIHSTNDIGANSGNAALLEFVGDNPLRVKTALDEGNPLFQGNENNPIPVGALIANVEDVSDAAGTGNAGGNGRASLAADYNRDGKLDLFLVNLNNDIREGLDNQQPVLLENTTPLTNSFLSVKLVGNPGNPNDLGFATSRDAIGSRVIVVADVDGDGVDETLIREVISGSSNATSTSSLELEFGLGEATDAQVNVIWADGRTTDLGSVTVNEFIVVEQTGPTEPLTVEFAIDGDNDVQRSMVRSLDLAFSASVNLGEDAFELVRRGVDGGLVDVTATVDDSGANVVLHSLERLPKLLVLLSMATISLRSMEAKSPTVQETRLISMGMASLVVHWCSEASSRMLSTGSLVILIKVDCLMFLTCLVFGKCFCS